MDKKEKTLTPRIKRRRKWHKEKRERDKARVTRARTLEALGQMKPEPVADAPIISDRGFKTKFSVPQNNNTSKSKYDKKSQHNRKRKHPEKETGANLPKNNEKTNTGNKTPTKMEILDKDEDKSKITPKKAKLAFVDAVEKLENSTSVHIPKRYVLFVGNLPDDITKEQVEEHFRKTGGVKSVRIPRDRNTDQPKGFAYVEFNSNISHRIALRLHNTTLCGNKIIVEFTSNGKVTKKQLESIKERDENRGTITTLKMPFDT